MLKGSQKTEYAMRAMIELALRRHREGDALVPARALAESQQIPLRFLEQQLGALHKAGLVESFRGAGGGCRLARDASEIRVADIVDAIERALGLGLHGVGLGRRRRLTSSRPSGARRPEGARTVFEAARWSGLASDSPGTSAVVQAPVASFPPAYVPRPRRVQQPKPARG